MRFAAFCLLVLLVPGMAIAQESQAPSQEQIVQARMLYEQGELAFQQERWVDCASNFEQSFTLVFSPELLYNIGRCYEEAAAISHDRGHYRRAVAAYVRYLREVPDADSRTISLRIQRLGAALGALPPEEALSINPSLAIMNAVTGLEELQRQLTSPVRPEYTTDFIPPGAAALTVTPWEPGFAWTYTLALGGATAVVAIASLVTGMVAYGDYNELADTCGQTAEGCDPSDISRVDALATAAIVLLGISAALLVSTGIAFFIEFSEQNTAGPAVEAFGLQLTRRF